MRETIARQNDPMDSLMRADVIFLGVLGLGFGAALIWAVARTLPHPERRSGRAGTDTGTDADSGPDWSWNWGSHSDAAGGGDGGGGGDSD